MIQIKNVSNEVIKRKFELFVIEGVNRNFEDASQTILLLTFTGKVS